MVREGNLTLTGNVFSDVKVNVHLQSCRGVAISGNTFWQGYEHNLLVEKCSNVVLGPNNFDRNPRYDYGNTQEANNAIRFADCNDCTISGLHVSNVWRCEAGVTLDRCDRMNLFGCTIFECDNAGLLLRNVQQSIVTGCLIRDDRPGSTSVPIKMIGCANNLVTNNLVQETSKGQNVE